METLDSTTISKGMVPVAIVILGLILALLGGPIVGWGGIIAFLVGAMLLNNPPKILFLFWLWASIKPLASQYFNNTVVGYGDELIASLLVASVLWRIALQKQSIQGIGKFIRLYFMLFLLLSLSFFVNNRNPVNAINSLYSYYLFPVVFLGILVYNQNTKARCQLFIKCMLLLFLVNLIFNIGWLLHINPLANRYAYSHFDFAQGTFASAAWGSYFNIVVMFTFWTLAYYEHGKKRLLDLLVVVTALLNLYLCHTYHSYFYMAAIYFVFYFISSVSKKTKLAVPLLVLLLMIVGPMMQKIVFREASASQPSQSLSNRFSLRSLEQKWQMVKYSPKAKLLNAITVENFQENTGDWLLGMGPGMGLSVVGMRRISPKALDYLGEYYLTQSGQKELASGSITESTYSGIISLWSDIGMIGFVIYLTLYMMPFFKIWEQVRKRQYKETYQRVLAEVFLLAIPLFLMANIMTDLFWADYFVVPLWVMAGLVWIPVGSSENNAVVDGELPG